ncbi:unnamed protein product [Oikopleura dioica]|uniref:Uncharacterized protein n=1 Tax=Oikopleura dioica TaxID=34765 RepID=E4WWS9_OIKDI|nr:unnamed protein product [Oikopleura dioica]
MKIAVLFASIGNVYPSANDQNLQSLGQLYKAHGAIANFVYEQLPARPTVRKLGGRSKSATAQTQERLSKRLLELQERQEHIVKRCGPGGFKSEKGTKDSDDQDGSPLILSRGKFDSNLDLLRPSHSTFLPDIKSQEISALDFDEPTDPFVPSGQAVAGGLIESPFFDRIGGRGPSYGPGFGPMAQGGYGGFQLEDFDPLGAGNFESSVRKRRETVDLEDIRATRKEMIKKIKELEKVFSELEDFVASNLSDCSAQRVKLHKYKLDKVKGRFQKVIERQGTAEIQRGRRRMRKTTKPRNMN